MPLRSRHQVRFSFVLRFRVANGVAGTHALPPAPSQSVHEPDEGFNARTWCSIGGLRLRDWGLLKTRLGRVVGAGLVFILKTQLSPWVVCSKGSHGWIIGFLDGGGGGGGVLV
jgi:hypothetical protein